MDSRLQVTIKGIHPIHYSKSASDSEPDRPLSTVEQEEMSISLTDAKFDLQWVVFL